MNKNFIVHDFTYETPYYLLLYTNDVITYQHGSCPPRSNRSFETYFSIDECNIRRASYR